MTNLERFKMELNGKEYFTDIEYSVLLEENNLVPNSTYVKADNEIELLETVVCVLQALSNDVDLMRRINTEEIGLTTDEAYKYLAMRIKTLNERILTLKESKETTEYSNIRPLFFNGRFTK